MKTLIIVSALAITLCTAIPDAATSTELLQLHNKERRVIGLADLTWSDSLSQSAQSWANSLASSGSFQHSTIQGVGENLAKGSTSTGIIASLFQLWADEKTNFIPNKPFPDCSNGGVVGHYTQIMWSKTTTVGCGIADASSSKVLVCHYSPPGNYMGQYVWTSSDIVNTPGSSPSIPTTPTEPSTPTTPIPTTPTEPTTPTTPTNSTPTPIQNTLSKKLLALHNDERKSVGVTELTWSVQLEASAQNWANYLAKRTKVSSSGSSLVGENIAKMNTIQGLDMASYLFSSWSNQKQFFNPKRKYPYCTFGGNVSYYTQIVWSKTTQVGCGMTQGLKSTVLVCHYQEKGNKNGFYVYPISR